MSDLKWYVVHTYSGYEEKAKAALMERVKGSRSEESFGEVIVPQMKHVSVTKTGKKKTTTKTSFPGYIIIQMNLTDDTMAIVKQTPRITGFVGNARHPRPLPENEVLRLTSPEEAEEQQRATVTAEFDKGENVKVTEGPFSNFDGVIDEVRPDKMKLRVLVKIFGRETPVELEYHQVEKLD